MEDKTCAVHGCVGEWEGRDNSAKGHNDNMKLESLCENVDGTFQVIIGCRQWVEWGKV